MKTGSLKPGFLIASPQMRDPYFEKTVVLICQYDEDGALGIVINREGPVSIGAVTREVNVATPRDDDAMTWWGGPVGTGTCFVLWRGSASEAEGWNLPGDIAVSQSLERLERLVQLGSDFHVTIGYAGWSAEQLDAEIERGSWLYTEADPAIIFDTPLEQRYDRALLLLGLTSSMVWMQPINE
ncbi:MAG: putative transcriptional regulator [Myxococcota bacterium]|jgi:putative transcriptional regulator